MRTIILPQKSHNTIFIALISVLILLVAFLHYSTSVHLQYLHEFYRAFFYVPIILAAFRYQFKGGVITAIIIILIYFPHIVFQWGGDFLSNFSRFLEMFMYLVIGAVTGILAQREHNEQQRFQTTAEKLELSYEQLKTQSEKLAEIEEQLRHSERLSLLGELSASLAHEVRNPLGSIWGIVEILQEKCKNIDDNSKFLDILSKEVKRLNEVVENFLSLAKKARLSLKTCNLLEIVQSVVLLLRNKIKKSKIDIQIDFPDLPILVKADEIQLRQIFINLILNSITAIQNSGSIIIKAELEDGAFINENNGKIRFVRLSIIDSGKGIEKNTMEQIFKPFYTTKKEGTGLGLNIVKRIADQNKWKIHLQSELDVGTTFTIIFPLESKNV